MTASFRGALVIVLLVSGCSKVPDVVYVDEDGSADPDASQDSRSDAEASCIQAVSGVPLRCCGAMQCVGDGCDRCQPDCGGKCTDPDKKYCCQNNGKFACLNVDDDCEEKTH